MRTIPRRRTHRSVVRLVALAAIAWWVVAAALAPRLLDVCGWLGSGVVGFIWVGTVAAFLLRDRRSPVRMVTVTGCAVTGGLVIAPAAMARMTLDTWLLERRHALAAETALAVPEQSWTELLAGKGWDCARFFLEERALAGQERDATARLRVSFPRDSTEVHVAGAGIVYYVFDLARAARSGSDRLVFAAPRQMRPLDVACRGTQSLPVRDKPYIEPCGSVGPSCDGVRSLLVEMQRGQVETLELVDLCFPFSRVLFRCEI